MILEELAGCQETTTTSPPVRTDEIPAIRIEPSKGRVSLQLREMWKYRELLYFLVWRDVKVRYKQTVLGVAWIVLQPLLSTVVFTVIFGILLKVPSDGAPYALFALAALVPWQYFSGSMSRVGTSLVNSANLITKVYFPRLIIPLSGVLSTLVDFTIGFAVLIILLIVYRVPLTPQVVWLPLFLLLAIVTALGFGLWLAALNVRYRDINYLIGFLLQIWMYATPVVFGATLIPERYRWLMALNPITGVVEGFRWSLIGGILQDSNPPGPSMAVSATISLVVLLAGLVFFRRTERTFADII
ncbi:MAG: phosphate ABC transporter permease [Chloroflexi bacterium HGW-Chloroflexi-1]|nr:MAG: phosphate ABC transporter permease [Chloroflexi bacterium HGW-Chloroflexi-1]